MDKVQFNTQIVNMRKTIKRAKVQLIHHLTRQIAVFRKKKGSGQQLVKNERRAGRLVREIEAIKDIPPDEVTMSAIINKQSLEAVLSKATSTAEERAMARLVHHKLISQSVGSFKDLVTDDLLSVGKKKEKLIQAGADTSKRKGSESSNDGCKSDDEDDDSDDLSEYDDGNEMRRVGEIRNSEGDTDGGGGGEGGDSKDPSRLELTESSLSAQTEKLREQMNLRHKHKKSDFFHTDIHDEEDDDDKDVKGALSDLSSGIKSRKTKSKEPSLPSLAGKSRKRTKSRRERKSDFFLMDKNDEEKSSEEEEDEKQTSDEDDADEEESDDEMESEEEMGESFGAEFRELSAEIKNQQQGTGGMEQPRKLRSLDSMFVGKLSSNTPVRSLSTSSKGQKNRLGQAKRQIINKKKRLEELRRPTSQGSSGGSGGRRIAMVDMPTLESKEQEKQPTRIIPGINAPIQILKTDVTSEKQLPSQRPLLLALSRRERRERMRLEGNKKDTLLKGQEGRAGRGGGGGRGGSGVMGGKGTSESLHPSWEAKRRKKEQESKIVPFLGKKVTFDD